MFCQLYQYQSLAGASKEQIKGEPGPVKGSYMFVEGKKKCFHFVRVVMNFILDSVITN